MDLLTAQMYCDGSAAAAIRGVMNLAVSRFCVKRLLTCFTSTVEQRSGACFYCILRKPAAVFLIVLPYLFQELTVTLQDASGN